MGMAGGPTKPREDGFYVLGRPEALFPSCVRAVEYRGGQCVWEGPKRYGPQCVNDAWADIRSRKDAQRRGDVAEQTAVDILTGLVMAAYERVTGESTEDSATACAVHDAVKAALSSDEARSAFKLWNVE